MPAAHRLSRCSRLDTHAQPPRRSEEVERCAGLRVPVGFLVVGSQQQSRWRSLPTFPPPTSLNKKKKNKNQFNTTTTTTILSIPLASSVSVDQQVHFCKSKKRRQFYCLRLFSDCFSEGILHRKCVGVCYWDLWL